MQVLVVQPKNEALPKGTSQQLTQLGCEVCSVSDYDAAIDILNNNSFGAIVLSEPEPKKCTPEHQVAFELFVKQVEAKRIATILYSTGESKSKSKPKEGSLVDHVQSNISTPELKGRIAMIERYQGVVGRLETQLRRMEQLGKLLNEHLRELDQEMELAGRLQQDFLPQLSGRVGKLEYSTIYRPVTWISGDMFDVLPIDDEHTGFYIADAVGHGMASGLLAMYMKKAIVPTRKTGLLCAPQNGNNGTRTPREQEQVQIIDPTEVMEGLNHAMVDQALPDCQFITACYTLFNHNTQTLKFARAGHPYPILIKKSGEVKELNAPGGLLGLSMKEDYPSIEVAFDAGDKIVLFTDGFEPFITSVLRGGVGDVINLDMFKPFASMNIHDMIGEINSLLDGETNWNTPPDDITVMGIELLP